MRWHRSAVVLKWLGKCLCVVAALSILDTHLMVAQAWAWANMINDRVPQEGVSAALDSTFSGDSPCAMCCAIKQERQDKQQQAPIPESEPTAKFAPVSRSAVDLVFAQVSIHVPLSREVQVVVLGRQDKPPLPPPRGC
jgi:hypothetical protein